MLRHTRLLPLLIQPLGEAAAVQEAPSLAPELPVEQVDRLMHILGGRLDLHNS